MQGLFYLIRASFFVIFILGSLGSCKNEFEEFTAIDTSYYPLITGTYIDYELDSILYDINHQGDTFRHYIREEIESVGFDNSGDAYHRIKRYERPDTLSNWSLKNVWVVQCVNNQIHRVERNLRSINLSFPVEMDKTWDGLVFLRRDTLIPYTYKNVNGEVTPKESINQFKDWEEFRYILVDVPQSFNGLNFTETATILQVDKTDYIERRYSAEVYAKNVGLVYKEMQILDTQCSQYPNGILDCIDTPWIEKAERGYILKQTVIAYGSN